MADQPLPPGKEWKGSHTVAKDSRFLAAEDLPRDRDVAVTIEKVYLRNNLPMQDGRRIESCLSLKFVGKKKELIVNRTNSRTLQALFGGDSTDCEPWWGKTIALFVDPDVKMKGKRVPGIRIRAKRLAPGAAPTQEPEPPVDDFAERDSLLAAIITEQMSRDMDDAALWALAGVDSHQDLEALPVEKLKAVLKGMSE